jgi:uncharacterized membrane protein YqhA
MHRLFGGSRYLILVAVLASYLAAAIIIIYSGLLLIHILIELFLHPDLSVAAERQLVLECIELIDAFLLGTAFYIVALGLYELFINPHINTPNWLHIESLEDLKARLLAVIILVLSVFFLEQVINWDKKSDILALGIAEALMIAAITLAIRLQTARLPGKLTDTSPEEIATPHTQTRGTGLISEGEET